MGAVSHLGTRFHPCYDSLVLNFEKKVENRYGVQIQTLSLSPVPGETRWPGGAEAAVIKPVLTRKLLLMPPHAMIFFLCGTSCGSWFHILPCLYNLHRLLCCGNACTGITAACSSVVVVRQVFRSGCVGQRPLITCGCGCYKPISRDICHHLTPSGCKRSWQLTQTLRGTSQSNFCTKAFTTHNTRNKKHKSQNTNHKTRRTRGQRGTWHIVDRVRATVWEVWTLNPETLNPKQRYTCMAHTTCDMLLCSDCYHK